MHNTNSPSSFFNFFTSHQSPILAPAEQSVPLDMLSPLGSLGDGDEGIIAASILAGCYSCIFIAAVFNSRVSTLRRLKIVRKQKRSILDDCVDNEPPRKAPNTGNLWFIVVVVHRR